MTTKDHLLLILLEEGIEVGIECSKALRFGLKDLYTGTTPLSRIEQELNDFIAVAQLLNEYGIKITLNNEDMIEKKKLKVIEYLRYSKSAGRLKDDV